MDELEEKIIASFEGFNAARRWIDFGIGGRESCPYSRIVDVNGFKWYAWHRGYSWCLALHRVNK